LNFKQYITELKRRNIFKAAVAYLVITLPLLVFSTDKGIVGENCWRKTPTVANFITIHQMN
jgi:hypothetical protein